MTLFHTDAPFWDVWRAWFLSDGIGILVVTGLGVAFGITEWKGLVSAPPDPSPTLLALDIVGALEVSLLAVVFTFLFVDLFDTAGTLVGVAHRAGLLDDEGKLPRLRKALLADSTATVVGATLGYLASPTK